jgi:protein-tyrosine phosphatase
VEQWIVDVHSHLVPSGDDGAQTIDEGVGLLAQAARHGTKKLYATPHIQAGFDHHPLTPERLSLYDRWFPVARERCAVFGLELQRGFELFPGALPEQADLRDYALGDSGCILIEFPGAWMTIKEPCALVWEEAKRAERAGLVPVLAHPERCPEVSGNPDVLVPFVERGWPICLNAPSLSGGHGHEALATVWQLVERGIGDLVASDSHSVRRPAPLDGAFELVAGRYGERRARRMFDGSALRLLATDRAQAA